MRYEAYMDGVALSSLDPSIYVLNILPGEPKPTIRTSRVAGRAGARVINKRFESTSVTISFEIHEYDTATRQEVLQKVQGWANGSVLSVSDRPTQQLRCVCETYPKADARDWTQPISMTFVGLNPPYWEDAEETEISTSGRIVVDIPGNAPETLVSCDVTAGASISSLEIMTGAKLIILSGLSVSSGDVISIGYDADNILYIKQNDTSIMNKRTAGSSDELSVPCGKGSAFQIEADGSASAVFTLRGCWL